MAAFSEEFLSENDFKAFLATLCCQSTFILDNMVVPTM